MAQHGANVKLFGNDPGWFRTATLHEKLHMKGIALIGALVSTAVIVHQFLLLRAWYTAADANAFPITVNSTIAPGHWSTFGEEEGAWVSAPVWWWAWGNTFIGITVNSLVTMVMPWWVMSGHTFVRWSTAALVVGTMVLLNAAQSFTLRYLAATGVGGLGSISTISAFTVQLVPAFITPLVMGGGAAGLVAAPTGMMMATMFTIVVAILGVVEILAPAFLAASLPTQIALRLVVLPLAVEVSLAGIRLGTRLTFAPAAPWSLAHLFLVQVTVTAALITRLLGTNMDSTAASIGLAVGTSLVEVAFRVTMPVRDAAYLSLARRCCGRRGGEEGRAAASQGLHSYYSFLLIDTMSEDIGILAALPLSLLFRLPARRGGQPIPVGDLVLRVGVQYVLEAATDLAPASIFLSCAACCVTRARRQELVGAAGGAVGGAVGAKAKAITAMPQDLLDDVPPPLSQQDSGEVEMPEEAVQVAWEEGVCRSTCPCCMPAVLCAGDGDVMAASAATHAHYATAAQAVLHSGVWTPISLAAFTRASTRSASLAGRPVPSTLARWGEAGLLLSEASAVRLMQAWYTRVGGWTWVGTFLAGVIGGTAVVGRIWFAESSRCALLDTTGARYYDFCDPAPGFEG